jgi:hypothetical protein
MYRVVTPHKIMPMPYTQGQFTRIRSQVIGIVIRMDKPNKIQRNLPLPNRLLKLIETGRWINPGDDVMQAKIHFIRDQLLFLGTKDNMLFNSGPLMGEEEIENEVFSEYRGSLIGDRDLPWIDVEKSLIIICNKWPGDDVAIALDYRTNVPRIIGSDWHSGDNCLYHEISPTFDTFIDMLEL